MHKLVIELLDSDGTELLGHDRQTGTMRASVVTVPGGVPHEVVRGRWAADATGYYRVSFELSPHAGAAGCTPEYLRRMSEAVRALAPIVDGEG